MATPTGEAALMRSHSLSSPTPASNLLDDPKRRKSASGIRPKAAHRPQSQPVILPRRRVAPRSQALSNPPLPCADFTTSEDTGSDTSFVDDARQRALDKLVGPSKMSSTSLVSSVSRPGLSTTEDEMTSSSGFWADASSLASSQTAVVGPSRRRPMPMDARSTGMLQSTRAFLQKELGDIALDRRPATEPPSNFVLPDDAEAQRLWLALQDGVLLLKLLNGIFQNAARIDRRDVPSAKRENVAKFLDLAQMKLFLHPNDLFLIDDLRSGEPSGFLQVCHTLLAIAQRIRPTSLPALHRRVSLGEAQAQSQTSSDDRISAGPTGGSPHSSPKPLPSTGRDSLRRPALRKSAISFAGDPSQQPAERRRFYGIDRRLSESAIDLVSIAEENDPQDRRRGRQSEDGPRVAGRSPPARLQRRRATSPPPPPPLPSSDLESSESPVPSSAGLRSRPRPLSATSVSSVPFPGSPNGSLSPSGSSSRPRHFRWNSELQISRGDLVSRHSRAESVSSGQVTEDGRRKRGSAQYRPKIVVRDGEHTRTYQLGANIGSGQFGSVYRALDAALGRVVAVKRIKLAGRSEEDIDQVAHEVDVLKNVHHPSIVRYEGIVRTERFLNLIMEYVESSLLDALRAYGEFAEGLAAAYVTQILEGLTYLHERDIVHCDLKAANVLVTKSGNVKIGDFGVCVNLNATKKPQQEDGVNGTPSWMAPEVIQLKGATKASDIWSLGCTILEMVTGKPPFADLNSMTAMFRIVEEDIPIPAQVTPHLYDFLTKCFAKDPNSRPTAEELLLHRWLRLDSVRDFRPQDSIPFWQRGGLASELKYELGSSGGSYAPALDYSGSSWESDSLMTGNMSGSPIQSPRNLSLEQSDPCQASSSSEEGSFGRKGFFNSLPRARHTTLDLIGKDLQREDSEPSTSAASIRRHAFIESAFSRPIECRICRETIRKKETSSLCEGCGIISHLACSERLSAVPCDLRAALTAYHSAMGPPNDASQTENTSNTPMSSPSISPASPAAPNPSVKPSGLRMPFLSKKHQPRLSGEGETLLSPSPSPSHFRRHTAQAVSSIMSPAPQSIDEAAVPGQSRRQRHRLSKKDASNDCTIS